jgi:HD domain
VTSHVARVSARQHTGLTIHLIASLALIPGFLFLAPPSNWSDALLIVVLWTLAVIADRSDVPLPAGVRFDATIALMLLCVALVGPLPALGIYLAPVVVNAVTGHERMLRAGNLANLASGGWQAIVAAAMLEAAAFGSAPAPLALVLAFAAGAILFVLGWAVGPAVYGPLWLGVPLRNMVEALRDMSPAAAVMVALGAVTVVGYGAAGVLALALFALVAVLPQSALTYVARTRPVARLDPLTAARRYGAAMAVHLGLDRAQRRELDAVIRVAHARDVSGDPAEHLGHAVVDWSEVSCAAGHVTEWWNGAGGPAGLPGGLIPQSARIAAVARTWAALTAEGSPCVGHIDALSHLDAAAGVRLDPRVVRAARAVVGEERLTVAEPAPEPRLHHLRVPAPLRRVLASSA